MRRNEVEVVESDAGELSSISETEAALIRDEMAEAVRRVVLALPEGQREAIALFEFEGLSLAETASALGIEPDAVKARLYRGREMLRKSLVPLRLPEGKKPYG